MNKTDQLLEKIGNRLGVIEKKMTGLDPIEERLASIERNMAYKKDLIGLATKKDLRRMEDRITKKINFVIDHFDGELVETKERLDKVEKRVDLFTSA